MATEIKIEDLRVGDIVTMLRGKGTDGSFQGDILRVEGVDAPFFVIREFNKHQRAFIGPVIALNSDEGWKLARISPEYAKAMGYDGPMTAAEGTPAQNGGVA